MRPTLHRPPTPKFGGFRDYFLLEAIKQTNSKSPKLGGFRGPPRGLLSYEIICQQYLGQERILLNGFCSGTFFMCNRLTVEAKLARNPMVQSDLRTKLSPLKNGDHTERYTFEHCHNTSLSQKDRAGQEKETSLLLQRQSSIS